MSLIGEGINYLSLVDKARNVELYKQLGEWIEKVLKLQGQVDALSSERNRFKEQIRFKACLERIDVHTFAVGDDEEIWGRCAEVDRKAIHLMILVPHKGGWPKATCPECKTPMQNARPVNRQLVRRQHTPSTDELT